MSADKPFDLIVYGASGFTGQLVAEYLCKRPADPGLKRWAIAGRNRAKLEAVRDAWPDAALKPDIVVADATDPASLDAMVASTQVVLTTVGPYQQYGEPLVAACAKAGTDYVDLCGEPAWMRQMIDAHEATAKASGARIVFSCGFDSIPFDLGVWFLQQAAIENTGKPCSQVRGRVVKMKGTFSGGTAASFKATMAAAAADPAVMDLLKDPFALTPGFVGAKQPTGHKPTFDEDLQSWAAPFIMAPINTRNVHRTNLLLGHPYGEDFTYSEMVATGPGDKGQQIAEAMAADDSMSSDDGPKPGEGPSLEERENGFYQVMFVGTAHDGRSLTAMVKGKRDPGYGSTSRMISESALCLLQADFKTSGGFHTPGSALATPLLERLAQYADLSFAM
ncbi:MAG: trans-acting enoyl reductase family protein [Burkholderiaceae bacterium]